MGQFALLLPYRLWYACQMEILLLLGLAGLMLYGATASAAPGGSTTAAQTDLKNLYANSPSTAAAVQAQLGNPDPSALNQYAAQLYSQYPALAKQLGDMALSLVTKVTGKSGTEWYVWVKSKNGNTRYINVLLGSMPVITYSQEGDDASKRTYLNSYSPPADAATVAKAKSDFIG
jgi:hypothetical protein